MRLLDEAKTGL